MNTSTKIHLNILGKAIIYLCVYVRMSTYFCIACFDDDLLSNSHTGITFNRWVLHVMCVFGGIRLV